MESEARKRVDRPEGLALDLSPVAQGSAAEPLAVHVLPPIPILSPHCRVPAQQLKILQSCSVQIEKSYNNVILTEEVLKSRTEK